MVDPTYDPGSPMATSEAEVFGSRLVLAKVLSYDFLKDDQGNLVKDTSGNEIPTGLLNVLFLDRGGGRNQVPFVLPSVGNSAFVGSLPEIGAFCIVGFRQAGAAIVIGFIPPTIHGLVKARRTSPNLAPGEVLLQSSAKDIDATGQDNFFRGARVFLDRYGRVKVETEGYELIAGFLLSNEFTADVARELDPVTGSAIFFREKIVNSVERRVDEQGNAMYSYNRNVDEQIGGNRKTTINGTETKTTKGGFKYDDGTGNSIDGTGNSIEVRPVGGPPDFKPGGIFITAGSGSMNTIALGNSLAEFVANYQMIVGVSRSAVVTVDDLLKVGGKLTQQIAGKPGTVSDLKNLVAGNSEEHMVAGSKLIRALLGVVVETVSPGTKVKLGDGTAIDPVVLMTKLGLAFTDMAPPPVGLGVLVPLPPPLAAFWAVSPAIFADWVLKHFGPVGTTGATKVTGV